MIITPDFSEASENTPVPSGVYSVRVDSVEPKISKKGSQYLSWKLIIFGAEGEYAKQNNRIVFLSTMTSGPGAGILKTFMKAALGAVPSILDTDALLGKELQVTLVDKKNPDGTDGWPDIKGIKAL